MKANKILFGLIASGLAFAGLTQSCVSDEPFGDGNGEGTLRMQVVVNSILTRAQTNEDQLKEQSKVYISKADGGLLYKYDGTAQMPDYLTLKYGSYVAEAWTGDSVPASFDSKFYRGYVPFEIENSGVKQILIECKIANVVVSVDKESIPAEMQSDWQLTVSNSSGSLLFSDATADDAKGYFMMPKADLALDENGAVMRDAAGWELYTNLKYELKGKKIDGTEFVKTGLIAGKNYPGQDIVEHAHEYELSFVYDPKYEELGGSFIDIVINDEEIEVEVPVGLYSRPAIKGVGFEIEHQLIGKQGDFKEAMVKVAGFNGVRNIMLTCPAADAEALGLPLRGIDLMEAAPEMVADLNSKGITWEINEPQNEEKPHITYVTFSKEYLSNLPDRDEEYKINFYVVDGYNRNNEATLRIAVGEGAVVEEDKVTALEPSQLDHLAIRALRAELQVKVSDDAVNPGIQYRELNSSNWTFVPAQSTRSGGKVMNVVLTGLKAGTAYEYRAADNGEGQGSVYTFTTESKGSIPYGNMETWSSYKSKSLIGTVDTPFPGENGVVTFWDSGNGGGALAKVTMTDKSGTIKNGGSYSAKLESKSAVGVIAAGNLFVGKFGEATTSPKIGAKLTFGQPFEGGSHPDALSVYVNYRPGKVSSERSSGTPAVKKGDPDHGQIFVAFATAPSSIDTGAGKYFDPKGSNILGYGQITWEGQEVGPEGGMDKITIPVTWYDSARTAKPTHIIIVCSASKYGDYYEGAVGSTMYVDDFELVYNDK